MFLFVHNLRRVSQVNCLDHHASHGAFLDSEKLQEVGLIDLTNQFTDFDITVEVLTASATGQVNEAITMVTASVTETVLNLDDVLFLEESDWGIL